MNGKKKMNVLEYCCDLYYPFVGLEEGDLTLCGGHTMKYENHGS